MIRILPTALSSLTAALLAALLGAPAAFAADPTPKEIFVKSYDAERVENVTTDVTMTMTDGSGPPRVRGFKLLQKRGPKGEMLQLMRFESPSDVKGTTFLLMETASGDSDNIIYLPSMGKVRRLASADKGSAFMGSDFTIGDITVPRASDFDVVLKGVQPVDNVPCYVLEATPATPQVKSDYGYSKIIRWVRKDNFANLRAEYYDTAGKLLKRAVRAEVTPVVPDASRTFSKLRITENVQTNRKSVARFGNLSTTPIDGELFTVRTLERR
jgi:uncharacterized protein